MNDLLVLIIAIAALTGALVLLIKNTPARYSCTRCLAHFDDDKEWIRHQLQHNHRDSENTRRAMGGTR